MPTDVILITGHPASGKTTLAKSIAQSLHMPLICRDSIKEMLLDLLGWSTTEWSRQLSTASWALLYQQVENLLQANIDHVLESNFDPIYANSQWQRLTHKYSLRLIQVRCELQPDILLQRYRERIKRGERHPGHVDQSDDVEFHDLISKGPMGWIDVNSEHLSVDTGKLSSTDYTSVVEEIRQKFYKEAL